MTSKTSRGWEYWVMRKLALAGIAAAAAAMVMGGAVTQASAADALTLQLEWVTQAPFAG